MTRQSIRNLTRVGSGTFISRRGNISLPAPPPFIMKITNEKIARIVLGWELRSEKKWADGSVTGPRWKTHGGQWPYYYKEDDLPPFISDIRYALMVWQDMIEQRYELSLIHKNGKFAFLHLEGKKIKIPKKLWCKTMEKAICKGSLFVKER